MKTSMTTKAILGDALARREREIKRLEEKLELSRKGFDHKAKIIRRLNTESAALKSSIRELLDAYWGQGDGDTPPEFIQRAATLSGWVYPWQATKPKGTAP